jgi:hypothetical protein
MVKIIDENILSFPSELRAFAPWREDFPNPGCFQYKIADSDAQFSPQSTQSAQKKARYL